MRTALKWTSIVIGGLIGVLAAGYVAVYFASETRLNRVYEIEVDPVPVPDSIGTVDEVGFPLVVMGACEHCHGEDLGGQIMEDDPLSARFVAPNITPGAGGIPDDYSDEDIIRALRHAVDSDGTPLFIVPAFEFAHISDEDLGILIRAMRELPPVDNELPESTLGPLGRIMLLAGQLSPATIPAEVIDHDHDPIENSPPVGTIEYGEYVANFCTLCHGQEFAGSPTPVEDLTRSPMNLTPGGMLGTWTEEDFIRTLRTGIAPDGYALDPEEMPWEAIGRSTDEQLHSLWLFLSSLPPVETEHR